MIRTIYRGYDITGEAKVKTVGEIWTVYDPKNPGSKLAEMDTENMAQCFVDKLKRESKR